MNPTIEIVTVAASDGEPDSVYLTATSRGASGGASGSATTTTTLRWDRFAQRFVDNGPQDLGWTQSSAARTLDGAADQSATTTTTTTAIGCHAVFGVLPLGVYDASIIYITEVRSVASESIGSKAAANADGDADHLVLPGGHRVLEIVKMQHLPLPSKPFPATSVLPSPTISPVQPPQQHATPQTGTERVASIETDDPTEMPMNRKTLVEYRKLLSRFVTCRSFEDGVHLYYSPTCSGLACEDMVAALQGVASDRRHRLERTFRWNAALLNAFCAPAPTPSSSCNTPPTRHAKGANDARSGTPGAHVCNVFVPSVFRGYVGSAVVHTAPVSIEGGGGQMPKIHVALVTRLSCLRAGTRYNQRGLDALTGMTANFSETTQIVYTPSRVALYSIVRGSIPLCWSQPPNLTFKPTITLSPRDNCHREVQTHLKALVELYGSVPVHCVDATSRSRLEWPLSEAYASSFLARDTTPVHPTGGSNGAISPSTSEGTHGGAVDARYTKFDIGHAMQTIAGYRAIQEQLVELVCGGGARDGGFEGTVLQGPLVAPDSAAVLRTQHVLFRVNCLDCLDRANMVQSMLCLHAVATSQLPAVLGASFGKDRVTPVADAVAPKLVAALRPLWAANGTALSGLYAGSRPHFLDLLLHGRRSNVVAHMLTSGTIALKRFVQQNFCDGRKQDMVSLVTRAHSAVPRANPFERRMTYYNLMVACALGIAAAVLAINTFVMVAYERYRFRADFLLFQCLWFGLLLVVALRIRKDPSLLVSLPVLK